MGSYDVMQVCLNGHQITDSYNRYPQHRQPFCSECGEQTITSCPKCNSPIRGKHRVPGVVSIFLTTVPEHCHNCGAPYPWTRRTEEVDEESPTSETSSIHAFKL